MKFMATVVVVHTYLLLFVVIVPYPEWATGRWFRHFIQSDDHSAVPHYTSNMAAVNRHPVLLRVTRGLF